jgi:hypothetical protein
MGTVYKARDTKLSRVVAIKVMAARLVGDEGAVARFQREGRALARITHPTVVQIYDVGEDRDHHYLVMEYVEGTNLQQLVHRQGRLPPAQAADCVCQVALGLQHAHKNGVIHRDLKPANLLLAGDQQVKVLDLGLARFAADQLPAGELTSEGIGMGTPDYAAPEQFLDAHSADHRADIYALGCTLYHLLTGRVPFPGSSRSVKLQAHQKQQADAVENACPEVPQGLARVVRRMMAKAPAERYQSMGEVAEALAPFFAGALPASGPGSGLPRLRQPTTILLPGKKTAARRWALVALLGLLGCGVCAGAWLLLSHLQLPGGERFAPPPNQDAGTGSPLDAPSSAVLTVSQTEAGGGEYRTITQALARVKPGMTVRVLDNGVYLERLEVRGPARFRQVTLEATGRATIRGTGKPTDPKECVFNIVDVPGFTLRGFQVESGEAPISLLVHIDGQVPGVVLERLDLRAATQCVEIRNRALAADAAPVVVRNCTLRGRTAGVAIYGTALGSPPTPVPTGRVLVHDNRFLGCAQGTVLVGSIRRVIVAGNVYSDCSRSALDVFWQMNGAENVLIANNTVIESQRAFRVMDDGIKGKFMQVRNNLFLGPFPAIDMAFLDDGGDFGNVRGPGDVDALLKSPEWRFGHNWREVAAPGGKTEAAPFWIPPGRDDRRSDRIDVLSRNADSPDFLRPGADSLLAKAGAGADLPAYVGAISPAGVPPWDWTKTWAAMAQEAKK